jgi:hypothetical protein
VALLRRPVSRFFVWATFLVAVAIATGAAGLVWWLIALVELTAWAAVTLAERTIWHLSVAAPVKPQAPAVPAPEPAEAPPPEPEPAPAAQPEPVAAVPPALPAEPEPVIAVPEPEPVAAPVPAPHEEPPRRRGIRRPVVRTPVALPHDHVRWNIWSLERLARDHPDAEALEYLVVSLREFADADGQLPADFDPLVRESFGELLLG